jgi:hypothetical protein
VHTSDAAQRSGSGEGRSCRRPRGGHRELCRLQLGAKEGHLQAGRAERLRGPGGAQDRRLATLLRSLVSKE